MSKCATVGCKATAEIEITHGPEDDRVTEKVCKPCGFSYLRRPSLKATFRPKPGQRFIHKSFLDNEAFDRGEHDVFETEVVTAIRKYGSGSGQITVFYTSAKQYDAGTRKGDWFFDMYNAHHTVQEWIEEGK